MEEVKSKVMDNREFELRNKSKVLSPFGDFGLSGLRRKDHDSSFFYQKVLLK